MCFISILKDTFLIVHYIIANGMISNVSNPNKQVLSVRHFTVQLYWEACLQSNHNYKLNFMLNIPCWVRNIIKIVKMCHSKRCWSPDLFPNTQLLLALSNTHCPEGWIHAFKHCRIRTSVCMLRVWEAMLLSWHICLDSIYVEMVRTVTWFSMRLDLESQFLLRIFFCIFMNINMIL